MLSQFYGTGPDSHAGRLAIPKRARLEGELERRITISHRRENVQSLNITTKTAWANLHSSRVAPCDPQYAHPSVHARGAHRLAAVRLWDFGRRLANPLWSPTASV